VRKDHGKEARGAVTVATVNVTQAQTCAAAPLRFLFFSRRENRLEARIGIEYSLEQF
jgi:hypothetical protein